VEKVDAWCWMLAAWCRMPDKSSARCHSCESRNPLFNCQFSILKGETMKKIALIVIMIQLWIVCSGFTCELTVRVNEDPYPPFFMKDESGEWSGLSTELAEALLEEAGCNPVYMPLPFKRGLEYLENGKLNMMLNMTPTEERKVYTHFIGPQLDETIILVVRKDSDFTINSFEDFKKLPKAVGIERGRFYGEDFEAKRADKVFEEKIEITNSMESNEKKLDLGRISGFLGYGYNVFRRFRTEPLYQNFTVHPFTVAQDWVYFGFSKKSVSAEMLRRLQEAYDRAEQKGVFEQIRQGYVSK
jgi:polar amino acid transport system substrate-binding protein